MSPKSEVRGQRSAPTSDIGLRTSDWYHLLAWPLLSRLDPERAHTLVLRALALAQRTPGALRLIERRCAVRDPCLEVDAFGLRFPNPVGLAAGLDKDVRAP